MLYGVPKKIRALVLMVLAVIFSKKLGELWVMMLFKLSNIILGMVVC